MLLVAEDVAGDSVATMIISGLMKAAAECFKYGLTIAITKSSKSKVEMRTEIKFSVLISQTFQNVY